jgi:putative ABC transport system substrate-binding protein
VIRKLLWLLTVLLLASIDHAEAQEQEKIPRIGYLTNTPFSADQASRDAFRRGLRELGYVEGKNIVIELRSGEGSRDRQRVLAAELVRLKVAVIVAGGS